MRLVKATSDSAVSTHVQDTFLVGVSAAASRWTAASISTNFTSPRRRSLAHACAATWSIVVLYVVANQITMWWSPFRGHQVTNPHESQRSKPAARMLRQLYANSSRPREARLASGQHARRHHAANEQLTSTRRASRQRLATMQHRRGKTMAAATVVDGHSMEHCPPPMAGPRSDTRPIIRHFECLSPRTGRLPLPTPWGDPPARQVPLFIRWEDYADFLPAGLQGVSFIQIGANCGKNTYGCAAGGDPIWTYATMCGWVGHSACTAQPRRPSPHALLFFSLECLRFQQSRFRSLTCRASLSGGCATHSAGSPSSLSRTSSRSSATTTAGGRA